MVTQHAELIVTTTRSGESRSANKDVHFFQYLSAEGASVSTQRRGHLLRKLWQERLLLRDYEMSNTPENSSGLLSLNGIECRGNVLTLGQP